MIITRISGGLGNQMFQYAVGKSIAKANNDILKLDTLFYPKQTLRKYELDIFNINENIASEQEIEYLAGKNNFFIKLKRKIGLMVQKPLSYYKEKRLSTFNEDIFNYHENIYLDGYWQNEKYFKNIRQDILNDFTMTGKISKEATSYLEQIRYNNSISIHIRRGDYLHRTEDESVHGLCDINYYKQAIDYISKMVANSSFFIFSDDIKWCKENFDFMKNKIFIDDTKSAFDDLELMKNCKHNIVANSTFSWWGAWLNQNEDKIVIAPKRWFANEKMQNEAQDIVPQKWVRI